MPLLADTHDSPFALLMARSFLAVPIGSPPSRLDLMSAFFGALTVALCVLLVRHLGAPRAAAAASALALGFGSTFWAEAVVASPHTPRNALLLGAFLALLHWADARRAALLWVATGLYVLSVADHLPLLSVLPALAFYVFAVKRRATGQQLFMVLSLCLAVACSGVARQGFAGPAGVATRLPLMSEVWMAELGLLATALAAVGISRFVKQQTRESALFVLATLGTASWALGSPPSGPTELLPALLLAWPIVGIGIGRVADACIGRTARLGALGLLLLLLPSLNFVPNHPASRKAKNHQMVQSRYTAALSQALPEQAVIVTADETREPAMRYWRFGTAGAPPVVAIPWNPDRIRQLHARGHEVYAFKPSRAHFELMGLRFTPIARIEIRMSLLEYLETIPRGSLVAAAAGSALVPKLGPQAARAFRPIGGAAASLEEPRAFYAIVGVRGPGEALERADTLAADLRVDAGDPVGTTRVLSPVTLRARGGVEGGHIEVGGRIVAREDVDMALAILRPTGEVAATHRVVESDGDLRVLLTMNDLTLVRLEGWEPCIEVTSGRAG